jgi:outer membrane protein TolC
MLFVVGLWLALGACTVDQKKEVSLYRDVLDAGLDVEAASSSLESKERLGAIDVMTLASLRNETLALEGETYLQALIEQRRAVARFLPTITLAPSYSWRDQPGGGGFGVTSAFNTSIDAEVAISPVRDLANLRQAGATAQEQRALLLNFQDTLLIDAARMLYEALRAERNVRVLENSLRVQDERVADARARLQAGVMRPLDVSLSEAQAAQTATALVEARVQAQTARSELALLTAAPMRERELVDDVILQGRDLGVKDQGLEDAWGLRHEAWSYQARESGAIHVSSLKSQAEDDVSSTNLQSINPDPFDLAALLATAEQNRQDLLAADWRMDAAGHLVESAYGHYFPSISLNLQYFLQRQSAPTNLEWTALVQVSLPLFSAGLIEADVRTALSALRQAKVNHAYTRRVVERDVDIALANFNASLERVERVKVQVNSAADALEQAEALYHAGLATNLERLTAQEALLAAELNLVNAELDSKVFYLDLRRTTGTLAALLGLRRESDQTSKRQNVEKRIEGNTEDTEDAEEIRNFEFQISDVGLECTKSQTQQSFSVPSVASVLNSGFDVLTFRRFDVYSCRRQR